MTGRVQAFMALAAIVAGAALAGPAAAGPLKDLVQGLRDTTSAITGGLTGGGTNVLGIVSVNDSGNEALVNLDVGGGDNVVGATVGAGSTPLLGANVATTGLRKTTDVEISLLGLGLDVDLVLQDAGEGRSPGRQVLAGSLGSDGAFKVTCAVNNTRQLLQVAANGKVTASEIRAWQRFARVLVVPIKLCPEARKQIARLFARSEKIRRLQIAAASDQLIAASLGRTQFNAEDVVAVQRQKEQLVVYVY